MRERGRDREDCQKRTPSLVEGKPGKAWKEEGAFQTEMRWGGSWLKVKITAVSCSPRPGVVPAAEKESLD